MGHPVGAQLTCVPSVVLVRFFFPPRRGRREVVDDGVVGVAAGEELRAGPDPRPRRRVVTVELLVVGLQQEPRGSLGRTL